MTKQTFVQKSNGDVLNASEWNNLTSYVNEAVDAINAGGSGSGSGTGEIANVAQAISENLAVSSKGNLTIGVDVQESGKTQIKHINIEPANGTLDKPGDIQLKPGDDISFYSHHRAPGKRDEVSVKVLDGNDNPVKLQVQAGEITLSSKGKAKTKKKDKTTGEDTTEALYSDPEVTNINVTTGDGKGYLKVRARAIDLRCEDHGGIALQPKGYDGDGHMNKIKFEHGGGDGLEFGTFNAEKTSLYTDEYRFKKDGVWKMATRKTVASDKADANDASTSLKYVKQVDDFYDVIDENEVTTTTENIIKTANALSSENGYIENDGGNLVISAHNEMRLGIQSEDYKKSSSSIQLDDDGIVLDAATPKFVLNEIEETAAVHDYINIPGLSEFPYHIINDRKLWYDILSNSNTYSLKSLRDIYLDIRNLEVGTKYPKVLKITIDGVTKYYSIRKNTSNEIYADSVGAMYFNSNKGVSIIGGTDNRRTTKYYVETVEVTNNIEYKAFTLYQKYVSSQGNALFNPETTETYSISEFSAYGDPALTSWLIEHSTDGIGTVLYAYLPYKLEYNGKTPTRVYKLTLVENESIASSLVLNGTGAKIQALSTTISGGNEYSGKIVVAEDELGIFAPSQIKCNRYDTLPSEATVSRIFQLHNGFGSIDPTNDTVYSFNELGNIADITLIVVVSQLDVNETSGYFGFIPWGSDESTTTPLFYCTFTKLSSAPISLNSAGNITITGDKVSFVRSNEIRIGSKAYIYPYGSDNTTGDSIAIVNNNSITAECQIADIVTLVNYMKTNNQGPWSNN